MRASVLCFGGDEEGELTLKINTKRVEWTGREGGNENESGEIEKEEGGARREEVM